MNRALWGFLLRRHRPALLLSWLVPVVVGCAAGLLYPAYARNREALRPIARIIARAFEEEAADYLTPGSFFNIPFQHPLTLLLLGVTAAIPALSVPAGERTRGALDLLLSTPLTRRSLVRTAGLLVLPAVLLYACAPYAGIALGSALAGVSASVPFQPFLLVSLNAAALGIAFGGLALLCSVLSEDRGAATARYVGVWAASFLLDLLSRFWHAGGWLRWLTPLGYYRAPEVVSGRGDLLLSLGVLLGVGAAAGALAERIEDRRRRA